jgi:phosphoglycolate phosphatase
LKFPIEVSAIAFDLDGTLVDTLPDLHEAANRALGDVGRQAVSADTVRGFVGEGIDRLVKRLLTGTADGEPEPALYERTRARFRDHYAANLTGASQPYPGVAAA